MFAQRYRDGRIAPSQRRVKSRTVEDALCAVGQKFASVGSKDLRNDSSGRIDHRIKRQLRSFKRADPPPTRVKPVPITLILYLLRVAYRIASSPSLQRIVDVIVLAFFFLLRPGEYTGTKTDDHPFLLQDVQLHLGQRCLNNGTSVIAEIEVATSVSLTFTDQKNGMRNEVITQGRSGDPLCCPVTAAI